MTEISPLHTWSMRAIFAALFVVILLGNLLPLQTLPRAWAGPDLLFCFAMVWSVRRPEFVPIGLLAVLFLLADLVLSRPPGLVAAGMLYVCYYLQTNMRQLRDAGFIVEWTRVALSILALALTVQLIYALLLIPAPPLGLILFQTLATILVYPIVVGVSFLLFGIRTTAPGDIDTYGNRL